ncbi:anti-phage dCTP deaminase [Methylomonas rosea]|uniref:Anti-phage dCTP deaminase n=1 Tax=Methylomonas rosea TaxID=2952227 RepID=A0ABT1TUR4_9GAMM|nr:anti-phage dCTP deaminase [Methylomonas sp. WSC-7]MCQ8117813.1 anti-phage dCTP deaminase [Methylomonas sp. WSC-7]
MSLKFTGNFTELQAKLSSLNGQWDSSQPNKQVLRRGDGVLNWFESTGTIQFQGKGADKDFLEQKVPNLLYPKQFPEPTLAETVQDSPEKPGHTESLTPVQCSIERKYLESGVNDSEIVIGIVSAVGTESKRVIDPLKDRLKGFGYTVEEIRVSSILPSYAGEPKEYERIKHYMKAGDSIRQQSKNNAILAAGVSKKVAESRKDSSAEKRAYIINSLKHPNEVEFLRKVYGEGFYLFGIHADVKRRHNFLTQDKDCTQDQADELIKIDEDESFSHGQKTRDTYHLSDFFLNLGKNDDQVKHTLQRFLQLIFSHPYKNPTFDEFAMFMAFNSSVRSGDLSRQVGAVITRNQQIIATGANDCPQSGGGLYWAEVDTDTGEVKDKPDGKDYMREEDSNKRAQAEIIAEIANSINAHDLINADKMPELEEILKESKISDLTEFGRVVHAEMEALLSCGRAGISTTEATLYCTTFPCHNCAKHIIAGGIKRVVYVEPYPKSRALEFHSESIQPKLKLEDKSNSGLVIFEPFIGVGPRRFLDLFSMNLGSGSKLRRKAKDGKTLDWKKETAVIRTPLLPKSYLDIEHAASEIWQEACR